MHQYLKEYAETRAGYVFSANGYSELPEQKLVFMPLYFAYSASINRRQATGYRHQETIGSPDLTPDA
jgi:hypothetical protein